MRPCPAVSWSGLEHFEEGPLMGHRLSTATVATAEMEKLLTPHGRRLGRHLVVLEDDYRSFFHDGECHNLTIPHGFQRGIESVSICTET